MPGFETQFLVLLILSIVLLTASPSDAFIPRECLHNVSGVGGSGICCPRSSRNNKICGGTGHGSCLPIYEANDELQNPDLLLDDRMHWPRRFFNQLCRCESNFFGLACDECWYGWAGPNCERREILVRRNVLSFSAEERHKFISIVAEMPKTGTDRLIMLEKDTLHSDPLKNPIFMPSNLQYLITFIHDYTSRGTLLSDPIKCMRSGYLDNNHNVVGFLTWHRYLMLLWERELRKIAIQRYKWYDFALPYWDWIDAEECEVCTNSLVGAPGPWIGGIQLLHPGSIFSNFTEYCSLPKMRIGRCFGCHVNWPASTPIHRHFVASQFPRTEDLEFTLSRKKVSPSKQYGALKTDGPPAMFQVNAQKAIRVNSGKACKSANLRSAELIGLRRFLEPQADGTAAQVGTTELCPAPDTQNISTTGGSGVCCPSSDITGAVCGGRTRGQCAPLFRNQDADPQPEWSNDDRLHWPLVFFNQTCHCEGNFFGLACDECWFGWKNPDCLTRDVFTRRNVLSFTPEERKKLITIISSMPRVPTDRSVLLETDNNHSDPLRMPSTIPATLFSLITFIHFYTSRSTLLPDVDICAHVEALNYNHNIVGFLTWHRYLMLFWERELRKVAIRLYSWHDFALPYWDWVDADECDVCTNNLVGGAGEWLNGTRRLDQKSAFYNFTEYCSVAEGNIFCQGCHVHWPTLKFITRYYAKTDFPSSTDLEFTLSRMNFFLEDPEEGMNNCRSFHQALEGFCGRPDDNSTYLYMHNKVHNMVHGTHCCSATSTNDPLFILHHTQIDRIFELWFRRMQPRITEYPADHVAPGSCRECPLIGWIPIVRHVQLFTEAEKLGIRYDNFNFGKQGFRGDLYLKYGPRHEESYYARKPQNSVNQSALVH
ncbi:unnamed protein product [Schistocephalus solidus]|uniref:Tyrosinase_Cu-bd domain-containing protein n=1 Tax=Schistocephalus solidus TaxID=70667 RepID=A0A183TFI9_SCHSO|nr:unnamed protein product [Schistocephalus solidus]